MVDTPNGPQTGSKHPQGHSMGSVQAAGNSAAPGPQQNGQLSQKSAALTQQQQLLQLQQLRQARAKAGAYAFASTSQEILRKYAKYPPSLTFHIYDTYYRFNNTQDSNIIPRESPMAKSFLKHVINEQIPSEMTELLKDFSVKFYDGCLVLQVYDHRNVVADGKGRPEKEDPKSGDGPAKPKTYRTLMKPTPQSLYYDLLYHTDSTLSRFTDVLSLQMEAEILALTNRKLDLSVPLNPYREAEYLRPEHEFPKTVWDEKTDDYKVVHRHRDAKPVEIRKLRQDQLTMQKSSEYEEFMFLLSNKHKTASDSTSEKALVVVGPAHTSSADAATLESTPTASGPEKPKRSSTSGAISSSVSNATSNQFMRLRFIEEIRKRKESQLAQAGAAVAAHTQTSISGNPMSGASVNANGAGNGLQRQNTPKFNSQIQTSSSGSANGSPSMGQMQPFQQNFNQQVPMQQQMMMSPQYQQNMARPRATPGPQAPQGTGKNFPMTRPMAQTGQNVPNGQSVQNVGQVGQNVGQQIPGQTASGNALGNAPGNTPGQPMNNMNSGLMTAQQQQLAKQNRLRVQQLQMQQARQQQMRGQGQMSQQAIQQAKRQKVAMGQVPNQYGLPVRTPQMGMSQNPQAQMSSPQMNQTQMSQNQVNSQMSQNQMSQNQMPQNQVNSQAQMNSMNSMNMGSQPGSGMGTPLMNNARIANNPASPQMGMNQFPNQAMGSRPATQPAQAQAPKATLQQQQQQQIFQMTLSPQEQHTFRQLQARMNALVQMGNTGVAPNRSRLNPQQQQQAIQQAKNIQQQLLQRFPTYFQRLRQFQVMQQQRRQAMQRHPQGQPQTQGNMSDGAVFNQNMGLNVGSPGMQQQMMNSPMMSPMNNSMPPQGKQ